MIAYPFLPDIFPGWEYVFWLDADSWIQSPRALDLFPSIEKLERVLGHNLAITADLIQSRVRETTRGQIDRYRIKVQQLDVNRVDWNRLIEDAAYRRPPFEPGDAEKGFRDSLVVETFQQLVDASPTTPRVCRIVLLAADKLLAQAARGRIADRSNVDVMSSLEELKGLINTLVAEVDENFIAKLRSKATTLFFEKGNESSLYYKEKLQNKIREKFPAELSELPAGANRRAGGTWLIAPPRFLKKEGQRIHWATRINIEAKAMRYDLMPGPLTSSAQSASLLSIFGGGAPNLASGIALAGEQNRPGGLFNFSPGSILGSGSPFTAGPHGVPGPGSSSGSAGITSGTSLGTSFIPSMSERVISEGKTVIEVVWSVTVSTSERLSKPKIESIAFVETVWDS